MATKYPERIFGKNQHTTVEPALLDKLGITIVVDVGACRGEYARYLYEIGYCNKIVSIEPVSEAYKGLVVNRQRMINNANRDIRYKFFEPDEWIIAPRMALGDAEKKCTINVSKNLVASSILDNNLINEIDHATDFIRTEEIVVRTMDNVYADYVKPCDNPFLKLDVQGYEFNIFLGAKDTLHNFLGIQFECSLFELYKDEILWKDLIVYLENNGFVLYDIIRGWFDPPTKKLLQIDVVMLRKDIYDNLK